MKFLMVEKFTEKLVIYTEKHVLVKKSLQIG